MPLFNPFNMKPVKIDFADDSPLVNRFRKFHNERTLNSVKHRLSKFIALRPHQQESGFTMFGIVLGDNAQIPKTDEEYCWNKSIECFGDSEECKKFLGSMLMQAFANDEENDWFFVQDPEKKLKLSNGEIPVATKYFLPRDSDGNIVSKHKATAKSIRQKEKDLFTFVNNQENRNTTHNTKHNTKNQNTKNQNTKNHNTKNHNTKNQNTKNHNTKNLQNTPHPFASLAQKFNRNLL